MADWDLFRISCFGFLIPVFHFLLFSIFIFFSFLFEQGVLLSFGLSPGGFFVPFLVFAAGISSLRSDVKWWFIVCASAAAGLFSATPFFFFLLFAFGGALFLFMKRLIPIEGAFSLPATLWLGAASYLVALSFVWSGGWAFGLMGVLSASSFRLFFARSALFILWLLIPVSMVWWLAAYWKGNRRFYALNVKR